MKRQILSLLLVGCLLVPVTACDKAKPEDEEVTTVSVTVAPPSNADISVTTDFVGTASPETQVSVYPMVSGIITKANYEIGDTVKQGAVLFTIDDTGARMQLETANAAYQSTLTSIAASVGGARELADMQAVDQIVALQGSVETANRNVLEAQDAVNRAKDALSTADKAKNDADKATGDAKGAYNKINSALTDAKNQLAQAKAAAAANPTDPSLAAKVTALQSSVDTLSSQLSQANASMATAQSAYASAKSAYETTKNSIPTAESAEKNAEDAAKKAGDAVVSAFNAYNITQSKIYPEQNAMYNAQLDSAYVAVQSAQSQLSYYTVKAPISGTIDSILLKKDDMAQAGAPAYFISNKDSVVVTFHVTEAVKSALHVGSPITASKGEQVYTGAITEISDMANEQTGLFDVKAALDNAAGLANGVSMRVSAITQQALDVLTVPYDVLYFQGGSAYVFVAEDGKAVRRSVTTGLMNDNYAQVIDGVTPNDLIITTWSSQLKDGAPIEIPGTDNSAPVGEAGDTDNSTPASDTGTTQSTTPANDSGKDQNSVPASDAVPTSPESGETKK